MIARAPTLAALALVALAGCREEIATPDPVDLSEESVSFFCQMHILEHGGPKGQVHLEGMPAPLFFAQVRDMVAYLKAPERDARIVASYVNDMGAAPNWSEPGDGNWITADTAVYVVEAGVAGGMGAPEIVPFADSAAAADFVARHGGRAVTMTDIPDAAAFGAVNPDAELETPK